jgi:predicted P-loop ATPase
VTPAETVKTYFEQNFRCVFWPQVGDLKGPTEKDWPRKQYTEYREGDRVGLITGVEVAPGRFLHDVDIDWAPGSTIALALLPPTSFVFGRASKRISHCFYLTPSAMPSFRYEDIDKTCLIELRGTRADGELGLQTMVPPSVWSKGQLAEALTFLRYGPPAAVDSAFLKQRVCLAAISILIAKHLGLNGFGHEPRLAWAGFMLRAGLSTEECVAMGEAISSYCNNREVADVRRVVESTSAALASEKKVKGGPAFAKVIGKDVVERINQWLGRDSDFIRVDGRIVANHPANIKRAIELLGHELSYDEFGEQMMIDGQRIEDKHILAIYFDIFSEYHFQPPFEHYRRVIDDLVARNPYHPVKQYLNGLVWDGVARIDTWLTVAASAEDTEYTRAISAIMLIAAVRRIREPGAKYDEMVVWESPQGSNKSSAAQALCPRHEWFSDDLRLNLHAKELIEATLGKWIIEASDLAGKRKAEVEQLKAMLSRQRDGPARMAYARVPVQRPRHFIIVGTTNSDAYLTDATGSRRFWPVAVGRFDTEWIIATRDQLWAEASVREAAGASIRLPEELWPQAGAEQEKRHEEDPWESVLAKVIETLPVGSGSHRRVTTKELWDALNIPVERQDRFGSLRIADIMRRLGCERVKVRHEGIVQAGYICRAYGVLPLEEGL